MDDDAETIRGSAFTVVGSAEKVRTFLGGREVVHSDNFASLASVTALGTLNESETREAAELGLEPGELGEYEGVLNEIAATQVA